MTIYVLTSVCDHEYGCTDIVGLFSTEEKAKQALEDLGGQRTWTSWNNRTYNQYYIEEWGVDKND
jgi:hypothetical protein